MSLFSAREWWSNKPETEEEYGSGSMVVDAEGGGGEDVEDDEDGLQAQLHLEGLLVEVSQSCKPGGVLQRLLEECEGVGGRAAGGGGGCPPPLQLGGG
jgi:hypothetical protein